LGGCKGWLANMALQTKLQNIQNGG